MPRRPNSMHFNRSTPGTDKTSNHGGNRMLKTRSSEPRVTFVNFNNQDEVVPKSRQSIEAPLRHEKQSSKKLRINRSKSADVLHSNSFKYTKSNQHEDTFSNHGNDAENKSKVIQSMFLLNPERRRFDPQKKCYKFIIETEHDGFFLIKFQREDIELSSCKKNKNTNLYNCTLKGQKHKGNYDSDENYRNSMELLLNLDPDSWTQTLALFSGAHSGLRYTTGTNILLLD